MKLISPSEKAPRSTYVATIGFFDGVHLGHRHLLNMLINEANTLGKKALIISFDKHPKTILPTAYLPALLTDNNEKIEQLEKIGLDACVLLPFDREMASLTAYEFLKQIIVEKLGVHTLYIGYDHRFGRNREEGITEYKKYGKELGVNVIEATAYALENNQISSSVIRKLITKGEVEKAKEFLSYPYSLEGLVVEGSKIGRTLGYPTANIKPLNSSKIIPSHGVYIVQVFVQENSYWGMLNIGNRPSINKDHSETIEVNILDFERDIYDEKIRVSFHKKIREEIIFSSKEELIQEIDSDKRITIDFSHKNLLK